MMFTHWQPKPQMARWGSERTRIARQVGSVRSSSVSGRAWRGEERKDTRRQAGRKPLEEADPGMTVDSRRWRIPLWWTKDCHVVSLTKKKVAFIALSRSTDLLLEKVN